MFTGFLNIQQYATRSNEQTKNYDEKKELNEPPDFFVVARSLYTVFI